MQEQQSSHCSLKVTNCSDCKKCYTALIIDQIWSFFLMSYCYLISIPNINYIFDRTSPHLLSHISLFPSLFLPSLSPPTHTHTYSEERQLLWRGYQGTDPQNPVRRGWSRSGQRWRRIRHTVYGKHFTIHYNLPLIFWEEYSRENRRRGWGWDTDLIQYPPSDRNCSSIVSSW